MAFKVKIREVVVENNVNGKKYSKATVAYEYNGQGRTHNVMSFSNPEVFKQVSNLTPGQEIMVETTKNKAGYDEWSKITAATAESSTATVAARVSGNYETKEERARRQVLIVRQSSLAQAVAYVVGTNQALESNNELFDLAQQFTDWVLAEPSITLADMPDDLP